MHRRLSKRSISSMLLFSLCLIAMPILQAAEGLAQQTSREGSVTVKVTPLDLAGKSALWRFELVFDTHVTDLNHDLIAITTLTDGSRESSPIAWVGDGPTGHHRKGVLEFKPLQPAPSSVTLKIRQVGDVAERSFTWLVVSP